MSATARTRIKARLLPRFPATINAGTMLAAERAGSALTLRFSMQGLATAAPGLAWRLPIYDPAQDVYRAVEVATLAGAGPVSLAQITDMSAAARVVNAASDAAAMRAALGAAASAHSHALAQISDMSAAARTVNAAADVAAMRTALGAAATSHTHTLAQVSDMSTAARTVNAAADATAMRTALGAAATSHTHTASQISDSQAFGRSMLAAATSSAGTALLDTFTASAAGLTPASGGGASTFLRADGTWTVPGGSGDVVGPASATDNAAARFDLATGKLLQSSPLLIADTTGALSRNGGGGISVQGTNTSDNAATGYVGEFVEAVLAVGSATALTSAIPKTIASISLGPGDWVVRATCGINPAASTVTTRIIGSISVVNNTTDVSTDRYCDYQLPFTSAAAQKFFVGECRISISATATIYLVMNVVFTASTNTGFGHISATRVR